MKRNLPLLTPLYIGIITTGVALSSLLVLVPKLLHDLDASEREWRAVLREWSRDSQEMWSAVRHEAASLPARHKRGNYEPNYHSGGQSSGGYATPKLPVATPYDYQPSLPPAVQPPLSRLRCCCDYEETRFSLQVWYGCPAGAHGSRGNPGEGGLPGLPGQPGVNGVDYPRLLGLVPPPTALAFDSIASDFPQPSPFLYSGGGIASALMKFMRDPVASTSNENYATTQSRYRDGGGGGYCGTCPAGRPGLSGVQGRPGSRGTAGWTGTKGIPGLPGLSGGEGERGDVGVRGKSGRSGVAGQRGADGVKGVIGRPGAKGTPGATGLSGARGAPGLAGRNGYVGQRGVSGPYGIKGQRGMDGVDGIQGLPGVPGRDALYCRCPNRGGTTVYEVSGGNRGAFSTTNYTYPPSPSSYLKQVYVTTGISQPPNGGGSYAGGAPKSTESSYPTPPIAKVPYQYPTPPSPYATPRPSPTRTPYRASSLGQQPLPQQPVWHQSTPAYGYNNGAYGQSYYNANGVSRKVYAPPRLPPITDDREVRKVRDGDTKALKSKASPPKQVDPSPYRAEIEELFDLDDVDLDRNAARRSGPTNDKKRRED